jgi:hypothetical protein
MPDWFPPLRATKSERIAYRRNLLRLELEITDGASITDLRRRLRDRGIAVSRSTVATDLIAIQNDRPEKPAIEVLKTLLHKQAFLDDGDVRASAAPSRTIPRAPGCWQARRVCRSDCK